MPDVTSPNSDSHFVKAAFPCDRVASSVLLPGIHRPGALQSLVELLLSITLSMNSENPNIKGLSKFLEFSTEFSKSFHGYFGNVIISKRILSPARSSFFDEIGIKDIQTSIKEKREQQQFHVTKIQDKKRRK